MHDLELHRAHSGHDGAGVAAQVVAQNLHHALGRQLFQALAESLVLAQRLRAQNAEDLRRELRHRCKLHLLAGVNRVTWCQGAGVDQTHNIAGIGNIDGVTGAAKDSQRVLGRKCSATLCVVDLHAALEFTGDHTHKCEVIAVLAVHAGLHLKDHAGERIGDFADFINCGGR